MEIERKFTVRILPDLDRYPSVLLEQGYLNTEPVVRVRRENEEYYLTYKGKGMLAREEYNLPLTEPAFLHLLAKADGIIIRKRRYRIPYLNHTIELDIFQEPYESLIIAEVEFSSKEEADAFIPPEWFDKEVTYDPSYHNSSLSKGVRDIL